ncbi:MAG: hypothetical protein HW401_291 [Parcubacteria group bacterium]|nr:hypothetical protein [Parcubacteria group bacterium]
MEEKTAKISPSCFLKKVFFEEEKKRKNLDIFQLKKAIDFDGEDIQTVGNNSFIRMSFRWVDPEDISGGILLILDSFEKARNLEITNWFIEKSFQEPSRTNISGIWITHRPK